MESRSKIDDQPRRLLWFRGDLRLLDNEAVAAAARNPKGQLAAVFVYDEAWDQLTPEGEPRLGRARKRFLFESLLALRARLRAVGLELTIVRGAPERVIPELCARAGVERLYLTAEFAADETKCEEAIRARLQGSATQLFRFAGRSLLHPADLPFAVGQLPLVFTEFRRGVEVEFRVRPEIPEPSTWPAPLPMEVDGAFEPAVETSFAAEDESSDQEAASFSPVGGEFPGRERLRRFLWETDSVITYKETRNGLLRLDDSSKLSPWLATGCLSPRTIYFELRRFERERIKNDSTYWLLFELLWRDYFQFLSLRFGSRFFARAGLSLRASRTEALRDPAEAERRFQAWCKGQTGYPLVDASMRELVQTGWMSNRGRQNVASFLAHDLALDWRKGARWFESYLIDYDPCSNWGNWMYVAGVGTDPRARKFNVTKQSMDYDPSGAYIHRWLPELADLTGARALQPWQEPLFSSGYPERIV